MTVEEQLCIHLCLYRGRKRREPIFLYNGNAIRYFKIPATSSRSLWHEGLPYKLTKVDQATFHLLWFLKGVVEDRTWEALISASFQKSFWRLLAKNIRQHPKTEMDMESSRWREKINPGVERYKERPIRKGVPANSQQGMQIWLTTS